MAMAISVLLIMISALIQATSSAMIKYSTKLKAENPKGKKHIIMLIAAMCMYGPSFAIWACALSRMNLAIAQPISSGLIFLFTILLSFIIFKEKLPLYKYFGFAAVIGGIIILVL